MAASTRKSHDKQRDAYLSAQGYRVLRFWNNDVLGNMNSVLERIVAVAQEQA